MLSRLILILHTFDTKSSLSNVVNMIEDETHTNTGSRCSQSYVHMKDNSLLSEVTKVLRTC